MGIYLPVSLSPLKKRGARGDLKTRTRMKKIGWLIINKISPGPSLPKRGSKLVSGILAFLPLHYSS
jgi:hypothetical protein